MYNAKVRGNQSFQGLQKMVNFEFDIHVVNASALVVTWTSRLSDWLHISQLFNHN